MSGLSQVMGIGELANEVGGSNETRLGIRLLVIFGIGYWKTGQLYCGGQTLSIQTGYVRAPF